MSPALRAQITTLIESDERTQTAIAREAEIDPSMISRVLKGAKSPSVATLERIADIVGAKVVLVKGRSAAIQQVAERLPDQKLSALARFASALDKLSMSDAEELELSIRLLERVVERKSGSAD